MADLVADDGDQAHPRPTPACGIRVDLDRGSTGTAERGAAEVGDRRGHPGNVGPGGPPLGRGLGDGGVEVGPAERAIGADRLVRQARCGQGVTGCRRAGGGGRARCRRGRPWGWVSGVTDVPVPPETVPVPPSSRGHEMDAAVPFCPPTVVHWLEESALARACRASWSRALASAWAVRPPPPAAPGSWPRCGAAASC